MREAESIESGNSGLVVRAFSPHTEAKSKSDSTAKNIFSLQ